jgi:hypothetical protein
MKELLSSTTWGMDKSSGGGSSSPPLPFGSLVTHRGFQRPFSDDTADTYVTGRLCSCSP